MKRDRFHVSALMMAGDPGRRVHALFVSSGNSQTVSEIFCSLSMIAMEARSYENFVSHNGLFLIRWSFS